MEDLRKRRTKRAIKNAFIKLVNERGFVNVTVKDIAKEAMINRQTFYNYYEDKYDLTEQLNNEELTFFNEVLQQRVNQIRERKSLSTFYQTGIFEELLNHRQLILALLSIQFDNNNFRERLKKMINSRIQEIDVYSGKKEMFFTSAFVSTFYVDIVTYVLKKGRVFSIDEIDHLRGMFDLILR